MTDPEVVKDRARVADRLRKLYRDDYEALLSQAMLANEGTRKDRDLSDLEVDERWIEIPDIDNIEVLAANVARSDSFYKPIDVAELEDMSPDAYDCEMHVFFREVPLHAPRRSPCSCRIYRPHLPRDFYVVELTAFFL